MTNTEHPALVALREVIRKDFDAVCADWVAEQEQPWSAHLAIVGAAREEVRKSMRGEPMDRQPIARVVALAGLLLSDARKREGVS